MSWLRDHKHFWVNPVVYKLHYLLGGADWRLPSNEANTLGPLTRSGTMAVDEIIKGRINKNYASTKGWDQYPTIIRSIIHSLEAEVKRRHHCRLLLTGRDTWVFAVLAERRKIPYVYIPCLSRNVANSDCLKPLLESHKVSPYDLLFDTGWQGSIAKAISTTMGWQQSYLMMSQKHAFAKPDSYLPGDYDPDAKRLAVKVPKLERFPNQIYPNRGPARKEAIDVEHLPKYLKSGHIGYVNMQPQIQQEVSPLDEFIQCWFLTRLLWEGGR